MKIAIQGHPTRGKEVIQILESLGGKNGYDQSGSNERFVYFINSIGLIYSVTQPTCSSERRIYTLEEFEREFPFKIGNEVIFPVKIGWASGKITGLTYVEDQLKYEVYTKTGGYHYVESYKLQSYPMQKERNITLTLDKAKEWYKKGGELKEIALQAFSEKELNPLPRSWEEFCRQGNPVASWRYNIPIKYEALFKLEQLRNCWWNGWEPEYNEHHKYGIRNLKGELTVIVVTNIASFLTFPTREMAEEFLECFRDLIEKAGDLI